MSDFLFTHTRACKLDSNIDSKLDSKPDSKPDSKLDSNLDSKLDSKLDTLCKPDSKLDTLCKLDSSCKLLSISQHVSYHPHVSWASYFSSGKQRKQHKVHSPTLIWVFEWALTWIHHFHTSSHSPKVHLGAHILWRSHKGYNLKLFTIMELAPWVTTSLKRQPNQSPDWFLCHSNC